MNFSIILTLDGRGLHYDAYEPPHLDDLLHSILILLNGKTRNLQRDEPPDEVGLPLLQETIHGEKVWKASAIFPDGDGFETLRYFRKKYRAAKIDLTDAAPNLQNGVYREYNVPVPTLCVPRLIAYASGDRKEVKRILRKHLPAVGKYRGKGFGRVVSVECDELPEDYSWQKDGYATRYLPQPNGMKLVRPRPPYWNSVGRVLCCEVGDPF